MDYRNTQTLTASFTSHKLSASDTEGWLRRCEGTVPQTPEQRATGGE